MNSTATERERDESLTSEQVHTVCANQLFSVPMNCVLALSITVIVRNDVKISVLLCWFFLNLMLNIGRITLAICQLKRVSKFQNTRRMLRLNGLLMLMTGLLWAFVPALMFDITNSRAPYILFILAGLSAGATVQAGTYSFGAIAFVLPIFASLIVDIMIRGGEKDYMISCDAVLYLGLLFASARKGEKALVKTVLLRIEATALAASLDREHTASKASAARFFELANQDTLTGLANRAAFSTKLNTWLEGAQEPSRGFYLFLLDLDHFKSINDTLGHSAGDEILKEAANRLRQTIDANHIVARLGGDEFAILFAPTGSSETMASEDDEAERVALHLLSKVSGAFHLGEQAVSIGVSIGVAKFPDDGATVEGLLAHADHALYAAKDDGRHRWRRFDASLLADATMARDIEHDLTAALDDGTMQVFYQPQVSLGDYRLVGLEALLRWNHPVHGWIAPPLVVAAARRIRKSELLTGFVLDQACRQILRLCAEGVTDVVVAINVSPSELDHYALPVLIERAVAQHGIDPQQLEVEITEEAFAASESALATLSQLSAMGVRLAIDDFGTGYSSIAYLRSMRVDRIKIDRSFVTGFADRAGDRILVQAILGIGRSFDIEVLAEGVETTEDVLLLKAFGCAVVQGYHFGRPLAPDALTAWLAARKDDRHGAAVETTTEDSAPEAAQVAA